MAYETGNATGPDNLLDKLRIFLLAQGWTVDDWSDETYNYRTVTGIDGAGKKLSVHKTGIADGTEMYFNFRSAVRGMVVQDSYTQIYGAKYFGELTGIALSGATGYSATEGHQIENISNAGGSPNKVYVNCNGSDNEHRLQVGNTVVISGTSGGYYDGSFTVVAVGSAAQFTIEHSWGATSTGTATGPRRFDRQVGAPVYDTYMHFAVSIVELSISAIPAYYFFTDGDTVVVVVEYVTGKCQFLCFGCLEKQGVYTGGQFFTGSFRSKYTYYDWLTNSTSSYAPWFFTANDASDYPNGAVYYDVDSLAAWRNSNTTAKDLVFPGVGGCRVNPYLRSGLACFFIKRSPNFYNAMAAMIPLYVLGKWADGYYSLLGWPKSIRQLNVSNYACGDELTYGGDTWKVFPATLENTAALVNPGVGFAIKKVV